MPDEYWRTYKGGQARQIISGCQILLDKGLLSSDEKEGAKRIQVRLRGASQKEGKEYTMVAFTSKEEELLSHVEGALWR